MVCLVLMSCVICGVCCCFDVILIGHLWPVLLFWWHRSSVMCVFCDSYCVDILMQSGKLVAWVFGSMCFAVILMARVISGVCVVTATVWTSTCSRGSWWQCATDPTACLTTPVPSRDSRQRPTSRSEPLFSAQHFVFFSFVFFLLVFCLFFLNKPDFTVSFLCG